MVAPDAVKKEQQEIFTAARRLNKSMSIDHIVCISQKLDLADGRSLTEPRNGGCEPRVICEPVPVDRSSGNNMISYPQCLEVHRCGGCCQEAQFPCVAVEEKPVTFSPVGQIQYRNMFYFLFMQLLLISLDDTDKYEINRPWTLMNHTKCECKCGKTEDQCQRENKVRFNSILNSFAKYLQILDATLCQCIKPRCTPECLISSTCSMIPGSNEPKCTCRRRLPGQTSNYCLNANQRPNAMCT